MQPTTRFGRIGPCLPRRPPGRANRISTGKPITMYVGFAPGGAADAAARIIAKKLSENIQQSVVVENKAGAGGNIVHQQVAQGPADGTVLLSAPSAR